ncbi:MAG: BON domain-containing protein [Proteobacteria bacterium]|nr:BON domain-containing protein [Pseudomonadota bacterium]
MKIYFLYTARFILLTGVSSFSLLIMGCVPVALLGVAGTSTDIATQERGISGTFNDTDIRAQINHLWFKKSVDLYSHILLSVQDGYVLLTGSVANEDDRLEAVKLAWQATGVKDVYNEIKIGAPQTVGEGLEDTWISTKVRSNLIFDESVHSTNYSVTTFDGVVYLMGIAQNQQELDAAIAIVKDIRGVKNVVSHVHLKKPDEALKTEEQEGAYAPPASSQMQEADNNTLDMSQEAYPDVSAPSAPSSGIQEEKLESPL